MPTPAPKIRADYGALLTIGQRFLTEADRMQKSLASLRGCMEVLRDGDWVGRGATAYYREMESDVLPMIGRLVGALRHAGRLTERISQVMKQAEEEAAALFRAMPAQAPTPIVTPTPPRPTPTATPTPQPPDNPFFDPLANENRSITSQLRFVEPPFSLLEGNPGNPPVDLAGSKLALLLQAIRAFNRAAIVHANVDYMANVEPNVDFSLHYSTYDDGVRIPGIRIDNHSDMPVVIGRAEIEQWRVASEEITFPENRFPQPTELVVQPGEVGYFHFDLPEQAFSPDAVVNVRLTVAGLASPATFGQVGWSVSGQGGAIELPPGPG